jgi:putative ABC transport system permease protein
MPLTQNANGEMTVVVRTPMDPTRLIGPVRQEIRSIDKDVLPDDVQTMETVVYESVARERFAMLLAVAFAGFAAILAAVGIYGVMAYAVARSTGEIGIRVAMGAEPRDIFRMIIRRALVLAAAGIALGLVGALGLMRLLASILFGVSASDPATYCAVTLVVSVVVLAASYIPARRATRVDPMVALRYE